MRQGGGVAATEAAARGARPAIWGHYRPAGALTGGVEDDEANGLVVRRGEDPVDLACSDPEPGRAGSMRASRTRDPRAFDRTSRPESRTLRPGTPRRARRRHKVQQRLPRFSAAAATAPFDEYPRRSTRTARSVLVGLKVMRAERGRRHGFRSGRSRMALDQAVVDLDHLVRTVHVEAARAAGQVDVPHPAPPAQRSAAPPRPRRRGRSGEPGSCSCTTAALSRRWRRVGVLEVAAAAEPAGIRTRRRHAVRRRGEHGHRVAPPERRRRCPRSPRPRRAPPAARAARTPRGRRGARRSARRGDRAHLDLERSGPVRPPRGPSTRRDGSRPHRPWAAPGHPCARSHDEVAGPHPAGLRRARLGRLRGRSWTARR